ncbi:MAG: biopolymer transporter ExbD [Mariprofundaceae bacterium]
MRLRERGRSMVNVDITALVDVVFLMLIFFMVSTSFNMESSLKLELPSGHAKKMAHNAQEVVIAIDAENRLYVQDEWVEDHELRLRILNISKGDPNMRVILRADASTNHGRVVFALDTIRQLGMGKVAIATINKPSQ